jgi:hypothetical protein
LISIGLSSDGAADDRALVQRQAEAVAELQAEGRQLVGKAEFLGLGPDLGDRRRSSRPA